MINFADRLADGILQQNSRVCVGLDPWPDLLPERMLRQMQQGTDQAADTIRKFCCEIIEAVADIVPIVKPQAAFFERLGPAGWTVLWDIIATAKKADLLVILDAKRSDIGSTAAAYAEAFFNPPAGISPVDAVTVSAYLGSDGVKPFVKAAQQAGGGLFVLVRTSNPSAGELQDLNVETANGSMPVYRHMGNLVSEWGQDLIGESGFSSVGAVVGATWPEQLTELRTAIPTVPFLVPGYGAQGGGASDVVGAFDEDGLGAIVSSSRGVLFACKQEPYVSKYSPDEYALAARDAAEAMRDDINAAIGK